MIKGRRGLAAAAAVLAMAVAPSAQAATAARKESTATFTALDTLTATIIHDDGTRGVLSVQAGLDVADARLRKLTTQSTPRLRDAYVRVLAIYAAGLLPGTAPNVDQIAQQLQNATDRTMGRPGVRLLMGTVLVN